MRCTPVRYVYEVHTHEMHPYEVNACEIHAYEGHTHQMHPYEVHAMRYTPITYMPIRYTRGVFSTFFIFDINPDLLVFLLKRLRIISSDITSLPRPLK